MKLSPGTIFARGAGLLPVLAALLVSCAIDPQAGFDAAEATYANPVIDRDFPDPAVLRAADGWFYVYATQGASGGRALNRNPASSDISSASVIRSTAPVPSVVRSTVGS